VNETEVRAEGDDDGDEDKNGGKIQLNVKPTQRTHACTRSHFHTGVNSLFFSLTPFLSLSLSIKNNTWQKNLIKTAHTRTQ
jgi:hypothetical protein